jgi:hypothetical protein
MTYMPFDAMLRSCKNCKGGKLETKVRELRWPTTRRKEENGRIQLGRVVCLGSVKGYRTRLNSMRF